MVNIEIPNKKKIAIFTNFFSAEEAYSLNRVVQDQIKMLVTNGYEPVVIVSYGFKAKKDTLYNHEKVELRYIPQVPCHNELKKDETFEKDVDDITLALRSALKGVDVVLTHDIIYQPACLKHNFAARRISKDYSNIRWLHWIHSATSPYTLNNLLNIFSDKFTDLVKVPFPNSFYIFFNNWSVDRIANNFGVEKTLVKVVPHPIDITENYDPLVQDLVSKKDVLNSEAICVYPCRLDRGKQAEVVIKTMAMLKEFDFTVRIVIADFHSTGGDKVTYRDELKNIAIDWGVTAQELTFTSEYDEEWEVEMPHRSVLQLIDISNVFIMPSVSESYSLVTQEAAVGRKVLVLNQDFPPLRDIFGGSAIFRKYSSNVDVLTGQDGNTITHYGPPDSDINERAKYERDYHKETAGMIARRLRHYDPQSMAIKTRKEKNLRTVFKHHLEPLFYA